MDKPELPSPIAPLVDYLTNLPHAVAITRRGSGGSSSELAEAWDLGLYYRGGFDADGLVPQGRAPGHLAGAPTYALAAELALGQVLAGSLGLNVDYPDRLAEAGAARWRYHAGTSLDHASARAALGDLPGVLHHLARAYAEAAHARLCEAREWALNEKEILEQAELTHLN